MDRKTISDFQIPSPHFAEEKSAHFTQTSALNDPSLSQLRDQIKKVMIPLLIKIFQLKLELNQSLSLPSRLQSQKNQRTSHEILAQLNTLDNDLHLLLLWCQSCRHQINKAIVSSGEEQKNTVATTSASTPHPAIAKSFHEALSAQTSFFQQHSPKEMENGKPEAAPAASCQKSWWKKLLRL